MATSDFLHGISVVEVTDGARPIQTVKSAVIGLVGTARQGPEMALIKGNPSDAVAKFGPVDGVSTIPAALSGIFDQTGAMVVVINVCDPEKHRSTVTGEAITLAKRTGKATLSQSHVADVVVSAVEGSTTYVLDTDYTLDATTGTVVRLSSGTIPEMATLKVSYSHVDPSKVTASEIIGGATGAGFSGLSLLRAAGPRFGVIPRILIAPGFTSERPVHPSYPNKKIANPVTAALIAVADRLRSVVLADTPNSTDEEAVDYRGDFGSDRLYVIENEPLVLSPKTGVIASEPASSRCAGLIAKNDSERGFWWSPSNQELSGISGLSRDIDWSISDENCAANYLNENEVACLVRMPQAGFRLWGNRTCSAEPLLAFLPVRRTLDMIYESLEQGLIWSMDRPISPQTIEDLEGTINAYLRELKLMGALLGGEAWLPRDLNTITRLQAGKVALKLKVEPPAPLENLTLYVHRNADYYLESLSGFLEDK